jgi:hypothetical protein
MMAEDTDTPWRALAPQERGISQVNHRAPLSREHLCGVVPLAPLYDVLAEKQDQRTTFGNGTAFSPWRLHSGPQSSSADQYSEIPPEHRHQL